jgi:hypothetical protein
MDASMDEIYIPKDLDDCFEDLTKCLIEEDYLAFKSGTEKQMEGQHHFLGRHLRNDWKLWGESRLAKWFDDKGIHHADDMSGIILTSYWRHLNDKPIELDEQIKYYQDFWKNNK